MHTLLEQIRAQIGNVKEYVNKGHHHRAIVTELEKVEKRFSEYEEVASLASLAPAAESEGDRVCHDDDGCPTENAVLRREWRKLTAQVAALTAQCDEYKRKSKMYDDLMHARTLTAKDDKDAVWKRLATEGRNIEAIKECRAKHGFSLFEAKNCVEAFLAGNGEGV
jgi:ribosomal protein L7/L12